MPTTHQPISTSHVSPFLRLGVFLKNKKEFVKKILLILITFSSYFLTSALFVHSSSLLLTQEGPEVLPFMMIIVYATVSLFLLGTAMIAHRVPATNIFALTLITFSCAYLVLFYFHSSGILGTVYYFLVTNIFLGVLDVILLKFIVSLITPLEGRSLLPIIYSFNSLGFMLGAFFADAFEKIHEMMGIGSVPAYGMLIILFLALSINILFRKRIKTDTPPQATLPEKKEKLDKSIRKSFRFTFKESTLFRNITWIIFLMAGLQLFLEFKLKTVLPKNFSGDQLTQMLGLVYTIDSGIAIIVNLFLARTLLFRFGLMNIMLTFPILIGGAMIVALVSNLHYVSVILLFLAFSIPYYSFIVPTTGQLFALVPEKLNEAVYFFIRGVLGAVFMLIFAVSLTVYSQNIYLEKTVNTAFIAIFLVLLFMSLLRVRKLYASELKEHLFKTDKYLQHHSIELLAEKNQKEKGEIYLRRLLSFKDLDTDTQQKTILSLGVIGNHDSLIDLANIVKHADAKSKFAAIQAINMVLKNKRLLKKYPIAKHLLIKNYEEILVSNVPQYIKLEIISSLRNFELDDVLHFLEENLKNDNPAIRTNTLETIASFKERATISYLLPFLDDENMHVVCASITGLWKFKEFRLVLVSKMAKLLTEKNPDVIKSLLFLIGSIKAVWEKKYVLDKLENPNDDIRIYALLTLIKLGDTSRLDDLIEAINRYAEEKNESQLESILSQYRRWEYELKILMLQKIQQLKDKEVRNIYNAFKNSKYLFEFELNQLS